MDNDALERLSKKLNSKNIGEGPQRSRLFPKGSAAPGVWDDPNVSSTDLFMKTRKRFTSFELLFLGSAAFFVIAIAAAAFLFFSGQNTVSTKNVDVQVSGPSEIGAGNTLSLQIVVTNRNTVPMQLTDLVVEFPSGTRSDTDVSISLPRLRQTLGTINPGESVNRTIKAVLFGAAGTEAQIKATAEYRVPSSNAIFVSDTTYTTKISESPAAITVQSDTQVVSGQDATLTVTVTSNSPQVLRGMLLLATYPPGFSFTSASPAPASGNALWDLGDIEPAGTRTITIHGTFSGEDGDQKVVTFTGGNRKSDSDRHIAAPLATGEADVTVTKPFISAGIALDGSIADEHTITRGQNVNGEVDWTNNLPVAVQNLSISLTVAGQILDQGSVKVTQGFFNSSNSTLVWDKTTNSDLANVAPGQSGTLSFSFTTFLPSRGTFRNPTITFTATVKANRQTEGNVPEVVNSTASTKALVATDLVLSSSLSHTSGSGPVPPKVNTETVYVVTWHVANSANALANTTVTGALPNYARYVGGVSPSSENVHYDGTQGVVSWNAGDLAAGDSRTVSFKIGVTPSVSQVGNNPPVIDSQRASGFDRFVQDSVQATADTLTTSSGSASLQDGLVVP